MTDFLANLVDRVFDRAPVLQRRRPSLFEPAGASAPGPPSDTAFPRIEDEYREAPSHVLQPREPSIPAAHFIQPREKEPPRRDQSRVEDPTRVSRHVDEPSEPAGRFQPSRPTRSEPDPHSHRRTASARPEESGPRPGDINRPATVHTILERRVELTAPVSLKEETGTRERIVAAPGLLPSPISRSAPLVEPVRHQSRLPAEISPRSNQKPRESESHGILSEADKTALRPALLALARETALRHGNSRNGEPRPAPPPIHVTIGRLEIRATPPATPTRSTRAAGPRLSLDEYLRSRGGGTK